MKTNLGNIDRIIRIIAGLSAIGLGLYFQSWWGAIGIVFILTALIGFCPIYAPFGISTCKGRSTAH